MFARRVIDVHGEGIRSAPLPYLDIPWSRLFLSVPSVNLKLITNLGGHGARPVTIVDSDINLSSPNNLGCYQSVTDFRRAPCAYYLK